METHDHGLFAEIAERGPARAATDDHQWVRGMLRFESALATAQAELGLVPAAAAADVARVVDDLDDDLDGIDPDSLGAAAAAGGNPVIPLVERLRTLLPNAAARHVHQGATSQDALDTAAMLVARDATAAVLGALAAAGDVTATLTRTHRSTPTIGRTLMQQALPTTFGLKAAGWLRGLDGAYRRLERVREGLPVQLGGPVGSRAGAGASALRLGALVAAHLELADSPPWHTDRLPVADLAGALGACCGAVGKVAGDVVLLAQQEVGEVREEAPGRGGSSSMAHKQNPVAAIAARASARRAPSLAAHLLGCMEQEHERAAGAWHAEWLPLRDLLRTSGSAAGWLADCLGHLVVDADAMARHLPDPVPALDLEATDVLIDAALEDHERLAR